MTAVDKEGPSLGLPALPQLREDYVPPLEEQARFRNRARKPKYTCAYYRNQTSELDDEHVKMFEPRFLGGDQCKRTSGRVHKGDLLCTFLWLTAEKCN